MNEITYPPGCKDIQTELANDELIRRLKKIQQAFRELDQNSNDEYRQLALFLGSDFFLQHEHEGVQLWVSCCIADIFRIYAPDSPYQNPTNLKNIFMFLANQLKGLKDQTSTSFKGYLYLLENLVMVRTFLFCQELDESVEIVATLFENVFKLVNDKTQAKVKTMLFELLYPLLNEPDHICTQILDTLFSRIIEPSKSTNKEAYNLAVSLIKKGNQHFEYLVQNHLNSILLTSRSNMSHNLTISTSQHSVSMRGEGGSEGDEEESDAEDASFKEPFDKSSLDNSTNTSTTNTTTSNQFISDKLCLIIYELNAIRPALLELLMPQLEYKLKSSELKERREYTRLLSKMFGEKDSQLAEKFPQLWEAYLERFADMSDDIRKICIQQIGEFLTNRSSAMRTSETVETAAANNQILDQIVEQIKNRSLDPDEALRYEVVQEILKAIKQDANLINAELLNILKERTLDVKIRIRKLALQGLATLYKKVHSKVNKRKTVQLLSWIPSKVMRMYFQDSIEDKLIVERLLNSSIVPYSLGAKEKMAQLYYAFCTFDDYSILSLIEIMKNRVVLYQLMKSIFDLSESKSKESEPKLSSEIALVSKNLMETTKGPEFMKSLLQLFKTNLNLKNYFKSFVNLSCTCSKTMQLITLIFNNLSSLNAAQNTIARRLIERMSSLIIDKECIESLIDLVEYKVKQNLTPKQRRMLSRKKKAEKKSNKTTSAGKKRRGGNSKKKNESSDEEEEEEESDEEDERTEAGNDESESDGGEEVGGGEAGDDEDNEESKECNSLQHIDDDGEKGLKLINIILMVHLNYGFANPVTYEKLFSFVSSRKDHVVGASLKILSQHFNAITRASYTREQQDTFDKVNQEYAEKLKQFCLSGRPKQAKHSVHLVFNNFEKLKAEKMLAEWFNELSSEASLKQAKSFVTSLVSLGHLCLLMPALGKQLKEFVSKTVAKEMLLTPLSQPLNVSAGNETSFSSLSAKRKNNLKLAGKWCENEDELPFNTRARIEGIKLIARWCLGLKSECIMISPTLKMFAKLIRDNLSEQQQTSSDESNKKPLPVSEAERARIRSICGAQILKMAQETAFKPFITAEYFHIVAKLIIDPVSNVRDILLKKLQKGLQLSKLPIYYMAMFALCGFDSNRERKAKIKKIYVALIKKIRASDAKAQQKQLSTNENRIRILPDMCLPYAVSLLAHNIQIDSLKDDAKVKQIKECMSIILDPLIESPDGYQVAYIKKVLNKIKVSDDGLAAAVVNATTNVGAKPGTKTGAQNLYNLNKKLCIICEVFLFHMHSKTMYLTAKEYDFDPKLPNGFYSPRENLEVESAAIAETEAASEPNVDVDKEMPTRLTTTTTTTTTKTKSKIEIFRKRKANDENKEDKKDEEESDEEMNMSLSELKKKAAGLDTTRSSSEKLDVNSPSPPNKKRSRRNSSADKTSKETEDKREEKEDEKENEDESTHSTNNEQVNEDEVNTKNQASKINRRQSTNSSPTNQKPPNKTNSRKLREESESSPSSYSLRTRRAASTK